MKKVSLLALVLIVALPGCYDKKKSTKQVKNNNTAKYVAVKDAVIVDAEDGEDDEDVSELTFDDEDEDLMPEDDEEEVVDVDVEDGSNDVFSWVDEQNDEDFKSLYFAFNHYGVRPDQKEALEYDVEQVKQLLSESGTSAQPTVVIEGHACQEGTPAYNLALSEKRAKNVADLFVAAGVDKGAIKVVGRGSECPAVDGGSREARGPNRRVEVRVIYT